jgi:hypothetical protein
MQGREYNAVKGQSWSPPCRQVPVNGERERGRPALRDLLWFQREVPELFGKRCTSRACKIEYAARRKAAKIGDETGAASPLSASSTVELESLNYFKLSRIKQIYGRRLYDPDTFSNYELRNSLREERDREEELAYLVHALWKEDVSDQGRSLCTWVLLKDIVRSLEDAELAVMDDYQKNNPSQHWEDARASFREAHAEAENE